MKMQNKKEDVMKGCAGMHLLVAEDNPINYELLKYLLQMHRISCEWAKDGQCCVDMFREAKAHTYDAILMDIQMPNMDGVEATRQIRHLADREAETIPIIALTTKNRKEDVEACLGAGMNEHLCKPVDMSHLLRVLEELRERKMTAGDS